MSPLIRSCWSGRTLTGTDTTHNGLLDHCLAYTAMSVLEQFRFKGSFDSSISQAMTTGRRFTKRTKDHGEQHVLDARTKAVLSAIANEPKGYALEAYLRAIKRPG